MPVQQLLGQKRGHAPSLILGSEFTPQAFNLIHAVFQSRALAKVVQQQEDQKSSAKARFVDGIDLLFQERKIREQISRRETLLPINLVESVLKFGHQGWTGRLSGSGLPRVQRSSLLYFGQKI